MKPKKILFVCKFNNTRSQIAAALFNRLSENKKYKATSAGIIGGRPQKEVRDNLKELRKRHKLRFTRKKTLTQKILHSQDMIIIVADDVHESIFSTQKKMGVKILRWKVKDGWKYKKEKTRIDKFERVYEDIEKKMKKFVKELK